MLRQVTVKYTGRLSSGKVFDKGSVAFVIGRGEVIPGWDIGIPGMRIGGRRKLTVPPKMGSQVYPFHVSSNRWQGMEVQKVDRYLPIQRSNLT